MLQAILLLFTFVFVIGLAYYITKKIAALNTLRMQGKNMKIIETLQLGVNQLVHLVKIGDKIIMIGVTKDRITYLDEIDKDFIDLEIYKETKDTLSFEEHLRNIIGKHKDNI